MRQARWMMLALAIAALMAVGAAAGEAEQDPDARFSAKDGWIKLFDGKTLDGWKTRGENTSWRVEPEGVLANIREKGRRGVNIHTERKFKDFELHIEFKVPPRGNSGVYLRGRKEIQVHDSYGAKRPGSGHCGGIYSKRAPDVNASRKAGEWQSFDVRIVGSKITVVHNGKTIHNEVTIEGCTGGAMDRNEGQPGPLMLQGDHSTVWYRNIYVKPLP